VADMKLSGDVRRRYDDREVPASCVLIGMKILFLQPIVVPACSTAFGSYDFDNSLEDMRRALLDGPAAPARPFRVVADAVTKRYSLSGESRSERLG